MPDRHRVDALIADPGRALGLDDLGPDEAGCLRIRLDETEILLAFDAEDGVLWLASGIGRVPQGLRDATLARLLAANAAADLDAGNGHFTITRPPTVDEMQLAPRWGRLAS